MSLPWPDLSRSDHPGHRAEISADSKGSKEQQAQSRSKHKVDLPQLGRERQQCSLLSSRAPRDKGSNYRANKDRKDSREKRNLDLGVEQGGQEQGSAPPWGTHRLGPGFSHRQDAVSSTSQAARLKLGNGTPGGQGWGVASRHAGPG